MGYSVYNKALKVKKEKIKKKINLNDYIATDLNQKYVS